MSHFSNYKIKWICETLMLKKSSYIDNDKINVLDCEHIPVCHSLYFLAWRMFVNERTFISFLFHQRLHNDNEFHDFQNITCPFIENFIQDGMFTQHNINEKFHKKVGLNLYFRVV